MNYRLSDFAAEETAAVVDYYSHVSLGTVIGFIEELARVLNLLAANPYIGQTIGDHYRHHPLKQFPYFVIYEVEAETKQISVVSVCHQRRRPDHWRAGVQEESAIYQLAA